MSSKSIYPSSEAFVYKWTNIKNNKIYIGKHKGTPDDGYISSGRAFLDAYHNNPYDFEREIIWYGTDIECMQKEWDFIREAINAKGYGSLYNRTHWNAIKQWKRTCLHCGKWCDPANDDWAENFELHHFENCSKNPENIKKELQGKIEYKNIELRLCKTDIETALVERYYRHLKNGTATANELKRLRKLIDKKLYDTGII